MVSLARTQVLFIVFVLLSGCGDQQLSVTESDAIELGAEEIQCPSTRVVRVYAFLDSVPESTLCAAVELSLFEAEMSGIIGKSALSRDSVRAAVVSFVPHAPYSSPPRERLGRDVTFDLSDRSRNVRVLGEGPGVGPSPGGVEVSLSPKGLRY